MGGGQDKPAWTACPPGVKITRVGGKITRDSLPTEGQAVQGGKINCYTGPSTNMAAGSHLWFSQLSHFLRNHWRNLVEILHMNSSQWLDMATRPSLKSLIALNTNNLVIASLRPLVGFFETCLRYSTSGLVVFSQKRFRSVDKYGHRQPSFIFTVIASPRKPLEQFCQNLAYEFL